MDEAPRQPDGGSDRRYMLFALRIVGDFGVTIAVPVVAFSLIGKKLDTVYGTAPRYLILGFILAAVVSALSLTKKAQRYAKAYEELEKEKSDKK